MWPYRRQSPLVMQLLRLFSLAALICIVAGCATPTAYRSDASHPIGTTLVAKDVPVPKKMVFIGLSETLAGAGGALAGGAVGSGLVAAEMDSREGSAEF